MSGTFRILGQPSRVDQRERYRMGLGSLELSPEDQLFDGTAVLLAEPSAECKIFILHFEAMLHGSA